MRSSVYESKFVFSIYIYILLLRSNLSYCSINRNRLDRRCNTLPFWVISDFSYLNFCIIAKVIIICLLKHGVIAVCERKKWGVFSLDSKLLPLDIITVSNTDKTHSRKYFNLFIRIISTAQKVNLKNKRQCVYQYVCFVSNEVIEEKLFFILC